MEEGGETGGSGGEEVVNRESEVTGDDVQHGGAEEVDDHGTEVECLGDGEESTVDVRVAEADDF